MRRRDMLLAAAGGLAGCASSTETRTMSRGLWRDDAGGFAIGAFPEYGPGLFAFDYAALRVGPLSAGEDWRWRMSSTLDGAGAPLVEVIADGPALRIGGRRLAPVHIQRTPFSARSEAVLSAEIAVPAGRRARATVLMIYGSGPAPKEAFDPWGFWFLSRGFAVVTYDKRGSGASGGDWRTVGLEQLAGDARAVLDGARLLSAPEPVMAWGASQAGWIMPQLGAAGAIDGIVMHAGSAQRPGEQILAAVEAELRAYGFAEDQIARARAYYALDTDVSRGVRPWSAIDAAYRESTAAGAEWILAPPAAPDAPERTMIRLMADFDPAPYWSANRAPILALFGGKDWIVPAALNLTALESMAPRDRLTTRVLADANHLMFLAESGVRAEYASRSQVHPEYFAAIASWLDARA
ncbi:MAG: CocE/NonD family hydrolase [Vitreimonas sp.]